MDAACCRLLEAIAQAARHYREAMQRYITAQAHLLDAGVAMDAVIARNMEAFEETAAAEDALYAALDTLDEYEAASSSAS